MATAQFGQAVRRWRDRVTPRPPGCPPAGIGARPGCAVELALLAGISVDYVTRLEQGRASNPSAQVVEALARALRLSSTERACSGSPAPSGPGNGTRVPHLKRPAAAGQLDTVAIYDASWTLLMANPPYAALMGDASTWSSNERSSVWRHFLGQGSRVRHTPESQRAFEAALVATSARPPTTIQPTSGYGDWSRNCAPIVTGSPSCGTAAPSATTRPRARPSTTHTWAL